MSFADRLATGCRAAPRTLLVVHFLVLLVPLFVAVQMSARADDVAATPVADGGPDATERDAVRLRGRVVFLAEALEQLHGVKVVDEARKYLLALQTEDDELHPLVEDVRGRAFRRDKRLRDIRVELLARRYPGVPLVQIIRVFELAEDDRYELDYWCDICAITMFELKACDCCQGPIELRRRPAP